MGRSTRQIEDSALGGIGRTTDSVYDRFGRLITLTGYTSGTTGSQNTVYAYNKSGLQTRVTYPDDNPGSGDRGYVDYSYDAVQRLTRLNHQDNTDTDIVYDSMGRRLTVTKGTEIDSYTYTASGSIATAKRGVTGNLDSVSSVTRSYDSLMNLTREAQSVKQSTARNVDYAYDKSSNILTLTYPNGSAIENTLDSLGRASTVKRSGSTLASYTYVGDRLKTQTYETGVNDVTLTATYDGASGGRLTRMAYAQTNNTTLPDFSYGYTAGGDITRKIFNDIAGTPSEDYQYDTLHRLTHTTFGQRDSGGAPYEGFVYDNLGNHLTQDDNGTTTAGLFNAVNEQTKRGTTQVYYDQRGNLTKDDTPTPGRAYLYNRQNMLTRVEDTSGGLIASYAYDALNRRIEKTVAGSPDVTTRFYYTASWQLIEETDATAAVQRDYVWAQGDDAYIDDLLLMRDVIGTSGTANTDYFACRHHNFNVVAMLDNTGAVVEHYDYNPYGKRFVLDSDYTADADGISDVGMNIGHQGLYHDVESELVYNRNRQLNVILGRWMQRDPLGYVDGMSVYRYTQSNPIAYVDPAGYLTWSEIWTAIWNPWDALTGNDAANEASQDSQNSGLSGSHNGPQDAFRHALWNCKMAQKMGADEAKKFADAHENGASNPDETEMDLHNNKVGRQLGAANPNGDSNDLVNQALKDGRLRILRRTGSGPVPLGTKPFPSGAPGITPPTIGEDPGIPYNNAPGNPYPTPYY